MNYHLNHFGLVDWMLNSFKLFFRLKGSVRNKSSANSLNLHWFFHHPPNKKQQRNKNVFQEAEQTKTFGWKQKFCFSISFQFVIHLLPNSILEIKLWVFTRAKNKIRIRKKRREQKINYYFQDKKIFMRRWGNSKTSISMNKKRESETIQCKFIGWNKVEKSILQSKCLTETKKKKMLFRFSH